jgi:hypothetical protein
MEGLAPIVVSFASLAVAWFFVANRNEERLTARFGHEWSSAAQICTTYVSA